MAISLFTAALTQVPAPAPVPESAVTLAVGMPPRCPSQRRTQP